MSVHRTTKRQKCMLGRAKWAEQGGQTPLPPKTQTPPVIEPSNDDGNIAKVTSFGFSFLSAEKNN